MPKGDERQPPLDYTGEHDGWHHWDNLTESERALRAMLAQRPPMDHYAGQHDHPWDDWHDQPEVERELLLLRAKKDRQYRRRLFLTVIFVLVGYGGLLAWAAWAGQVAP